MSYRWPYCILNAHLSIFPDNFLKIGLIVNIKYLRDDALSWHYFWKINSRLGTGYIAEMRRLSRARYHRAETRMRTEKNGRGLDFK